MSKKHPEEKISFLSQQKNKFLTIFIVFLLITVAYLLGKSQNLYLGAKEKVVSFPSVQVTAGPIATPSPTEVIYYHQSQAIQSAPVTPTPTPQPSKVAVFLDGATWNCDSSGVDAVKSAVSSYSQASTTYNSCMGQASQKYNSCYSTCLSASNSGGNLGTCTSLCNTEQSNDQSMCSIPLNAAQQSFFNARNQYCGN
ncbi:MAG TPA: hypothetical protein VN711_03320 [Candidatus Saccharimonadales bacterium]|nr:hypothetical protein [Candidatus Saccharimonadales bacterium]